MLLLAGIASAGVAPQNETTQVRTARPGDVYRGTIVLQNSGQSPATVKVYQTDYAFTADGRNYFGEAGKLPRSNAPWLRLSQEQISIGPGAKSRVEYEVRVPDDGKLVGTYWSALMVEELSALESGAAQSGEAQLRQSIRYAVQVITEIGDSGKLEIAFSQARLTTENGKRWFWVDLTNTGERWLRSELLLELHDAQGRPAGKFSAGRFRTFPDTSMRSRIDLTAVPPGKYLALLVADGGRNDLFGTEIELDIR
jgi:hypothetical protein